MGTPVIRNLVFEGGGTKGAAYGGCMAVFARHDLFGAVEQVGGTSAGSITAALLATGIGPQNLSGSILHTSFASFIGDPWGLLGEVVRLLRRWGLHSGDPLVRQLKANFKASCGDGEVTFAQLAERARAEPKRFKQLSVVASNVTRQQPRVFCAETTPDLPVWQAVRASVSIPGVFRPMEIDGDFYVDGGLSWNYPIGLFDRGLPDGGAERNPETLGFFLEPQKQFKAHDRTPLQPAPVTVKSLKSYGMAVATFVVDTANSERLHPDDRSRTVFIDDDGISGVQFDTTKAQIEQLIKNGADATEAYLNAR